MRGLTASAVATTPRLSFAARPLRAPPAPAGAATTVYHPLLLPPSPPPPAPVALIASEPMPSPASSVALRGPAVRRWAPSRRRCGGRGNGAARPVGYPCPPLPREGLICGSARCGGRVSRAAGRVRILKGLGDHPVFFMVGHACALSWQVCGVMYVLVVCDDSMHGRPGETRRSREGSKSRAGGSDRMVALCGACGLPRVTRYGCGHPRPHPFS